MQAWLTGKGSINNIESEIANLVREIGDRINDKNLSAVLISKISN